MLDRLRKAFSRRQLPPATASLTEWVSHTIRTSETVVNTLSPSQSMELVRRATQWVMLCASKNAGVCSQIPVRLYTSKGSRTAKRLDRKRLSKRRFMATKNRPVEDVYEVEDHEVLQVLQRPNPYMSGMEANYFRHLCLEVTGNAYSYAPDRGVLLPLWPQWVQVVGSKSDLVSGYTYGNGEVGTEFPADAVVHSKFAPSLFSALYGASPLAAIFREADMYLYSTESENARWKNEGRPPYAIEVPPGMTPEQRKQVIAEIERSIKGVRNAGRGIAMAMTKLTPLGWTPKEMEFIQGLERTERTIWAAYDIPESVIRPNEGSLAAAAVGYPGWMKAGIKPRLARDADNLTHKLLPRYGLDPAVYWLEYDMPSEAEEVERSKRLVELTNAAHLTLDEARAECGYDPLPDGLGEIPRFNGTPLAGESDDGMGEPEGDGGPKEDVPAQDTGQERGDRGSGGDGEGETKSFRLVRKDLKSTLEEEIAALVAGLTTADRPLFVDWGAFQARVAASLTVEYVRGAKQAIADIGRPELAATWDVVPVEAVQKVNQHAGLLIEQIRGGTYEDIRRRISEGLESGESIETIRNKLMEDGYPANRAEVIARTETAWALESGRAVVMKMAGMKSKKWLTAGEPCPSCEGFEIFTSEKVVGIDQAFVLAGESWDGTDGKTYTADRDIEHGPLHPNCRCTALYSEDPVKPQGTGVKP